MNKSLTHYLLILALLAISAVQLNAQQFFFSTEKPGSCGAADGIITIVPTRGVAPFTYLWSTGSTDVSLRNIPKGVYHATMTDASGATIVHTCYLNTKELDIKLVQSIPAGGCNPLSGTLKVEAESGVAPYTYSWSNGQTGDLNQGLPSGQYTVTVQDANGCTAETAFDVGLASNNYYKEAKINVSAQPDCAATTTGELEAAMYYSPYPPYTYQWNNGASGPIVGNLSEGVYTVTATDALGCTATTTISLYNKMNNSGNVICSGNNTGSLDALLVNATAPVSYVWSNGQNGSHLSSLTSGTYTVTATDAAGCTAIGQVDVAAPYLGLSSATPYCYTGNKGAGYVFLYNDQALTYLWDNGVTDNWNTTLSPGSHSITVTTALGCTLTGSINIPAPLAPGITITATTTPADCSNNLGGAINLSVTGGLPPFNYSIYGSNGFSSNDINSLQNLQGGNYNISVYSVNNFSCGGGTTINLPDAGGFEPVLAVDEIDCNTGFGAGAIQGVTTPGAQYNWSNGATSPALLNLTEGCYAITVTAGASCNRYFNFCLYSHEDSLQFNSCSALASGQLINDQGISGCNGTQGIPYQLIRTLPSGALNFTDNNGNFSVGLPTGTFDLEAANYNPADIACPAGGKHTVNAVLGTPITGLDFHFLNINPTDHRLRQRPLRTAQPGYPYSLRLDVCNDGGSANPGSLDLDYGNFLGAATGHFFAQHAGAFSLNNETSGIPDNSANFSFPAITPGTCELLQLDLLTPTNTTLNTAFLTRATVSPASGDPTPDNNTSTIHGIVMGAFDPNCVLAYPVRSGNPRDGGEILRFEDKTIVYQIYFQNTGNAPADRVVVRDPLDSHLNINTIRNITASHDMKVSVNEDNDQLLFEFNNINLPDSTTDYAGSIGYIQYEIDLNAGLPAGTDIEKQVGIYFDFNAPVITNHNVLEIVNAANIKQLTNENAVAIAPNPTNTQFTFYCNEPSEMRIYNTIGALISAESIAGGNHQINTTQWPNGIYLLQLEANGVVRSGKVIVQH